MNIIPQVRRHDVFTINEMEQDCLRRTKGHGPGDKLQLKVAVR